MKYIQAIQSNIIPSEIEHLSIENRINEYIMTSLRTSKGMNLNQLSHNFGEEHAEEIIQGLDPFLEKEWIINKDHIVTLTRTGKLFADHIASELFVDSLKINRSHKNEK